MATLTDVAAECGVSSRWISQMIAEGILPSYPRGKFDLDVMVSEYFLHRREQLIAKHRAPEVYRAALLQLLRKHGDHKDADMLEKNNGADTRWRYSKAA